MITHTFDLTKFEEVELIPIGDVHLGNPRCNEQLFKEIIEYIKEEPTNPKCARVCLLNGDMCEAITKTTKCGDIFDGQIYDPITQLALLKQYLLPLTETSKKYPQGKIISNCFGNHDHMRQYKDSGISIATSLACGLGIEEISSDDGIYTFLKLKSIYSNRDNCCITIYNQHMTGGGTTIGAKANRVGKISNGIYADLIIGSHVHTPMTFKEDFILPNTNTNSLRQSTITYLITNAFLDFGDYSQKMGMKPSTIKVPRVIIHQERKQIFEGKKKVGDERNKIIDVIL